MLLSYNGESCSNYVLGNPNTYRGKTATWTNVHLLASFDNVQFSYNCSGTRMAKACGNVLTKFAINGSDIIAQDVITYNGNEVVSSQRILFYYGLDGVTAFKYGNAYYYYKKNFLGDIIGIYDDFDNLVAKYVYDAWGNHKVLNPDGTENTSPDFVGNINPFRYRSYYFDVETGFYYLQSRYYDPQVGRFISMDQVEYLAPDVVNGLNLYAYCLNNPVMGYDPEGTWNWKKAIGSVAAAVVVVAASAAVVAAVTVTGGLASAVLLGAGIGALGAVSNSIESQGGLKNLSNIDPFKVAASGLVGGVIGAASGAFSYGVSQVVSGIGSGLGQALSNSCFKGVQIGKVFNSEVIEGVGKLTGYALGMVGANTFFDYSLNEISSNDEDVDSFWYDVLVMSGASFVIDFIRLFK